MSGFPIHLHPRHVLPFFQPPTHPINSPSNNLPTILYPLCPHSPPSAPALGQPTLQSGSPIEWGATLTSLGFSRSERRWKEKQMEQTPRRRSHKKSCFLITLLRGSALNCIPFLSPSSGWYLGNQVPRFTKNDRPTWWLFDRGQVTDYLSCEMRLIK